MAAQRTRIDPALPLLWESLETLRIGFDHALIRIDHPSAAVQRLLTRLQRGIVTNTLADVAAETGCTPAERDKVQYACAPVLTTQLATALSPDSTTGTNSDLARHPTVVAVLGNESTRNRILQSFCCRGFQPHPARTLGELHEGLAAPPDLVVHIERFWALPTALQELVMLGYPHLSIRFSDQSVTIGPIVTPNSTPCGVCMQIADTRTDPLLPMLAAQLLTTSPASETAAVTDFASSVAYSLWQSYKSSQRNIKHFAFRYPVCAGKVHPAANVTEYTQHADCACHLSFDRSSESQQHVTRADTEQKSA